jgi:hypothetical protein
MFEVVTLDCLRTVCVFQLVCKLLGPVLKYYSKWWCVGSKLVKEF